MRPVAHAIELAFDDAARREIAVAFDALEARGITALRGTSPHVHPHVSITVAADGAPSELADALVGAAALCPDEVALSSVGAFLTPEPVVFYGVTPTAALLALNGRVHELLAGHGVNLWPLYAPDCWVPHCTLAMRPRSLATAMDALGGIRLPIAAATAGLRIVEVPTGKVAAIVR
ncbi:MAG TPA: 2'-5' RNA ligase family protein [Acidimicrobiales bacterium]